MREKVVMKVVLLFLVLLVVGCTNLINEELATSTAKPTPDQDVSATVESTRPVAAPLQVIYAEHKVFVRGLDGERDCFSQSRKYRIDITVDAVGFWAVPDTTGRGEYKSFGDSSEEYFHFRGHAEITLEGEGAKINLYTTKRDGVPVAHVLEYEYTEAMSIPIKWGEVEIYHEVPIVTFSGRDSAGRYCVEFHSEETEEKFEDPQLQA